MIAVSPQVGQGDPPSKLTYLYDLPAAGVVLSTAKQKTRCVVRCTVCVCVRNSRVFYSNLDLLFTELSCHVITRVY